MSSRAPTVPLLPRRRLAGLAFGAMRSSRRGSGWDLAGSRPYRPGDDLRTIDHRASARLSSASGADELIVRVQYAEEATRVVLVVDRRPAMALFPEPFPWLHKPRAIAEAGRLIVESALEARCFLGYLDDVGGEEAGAETRCWRPPDGQTEAWELTERLLPSRVFRGSEDSLGRSLTHLASVGRTLPPGSFVFLLSDFLVFPPEEVWHGALRRGWDLVPVVIQDPRWEQSFPDVSGTALSIVDPASGHGLLARLTRAEVLARRRANEERLRRIRSSFEVDGLDWVLVSGDDRDSVFEAFRAWAGSRQGDARRLR